MPDQRTLQSAVAVIGVALAGAAQAETLTVQTSFNQGAFAVEYLMTNWAPKLLEMTGGDIGINIVPADTVVPYRETPEAVAAGVLDGDHTSIAYFSNREAAFAILGDLIGGYDLPAQITGFCREGGGTELLQSTFDTFLPGKIHVVGCSPYSREALVSSIPIRRLGDLKGIKIRSPEGLAADVFRRAGAEPVTLPQSELKSSLEKGIVQAADASAYANNDALGFNQIARYPIYPGIHSMAANQFTLNRKKWESFSVEDQQALQEWFYLSMVDLTRAVDEEDKRLVERDRADGEIEIIDWRRSDRDGLRELARDAWTDFAAKSPMGQKSLDAHLAYMKKIGLLQ